MCNPILASARKGNLEIATSALSLVEVCKGSMGKTISKDSLESFFRNSYVLVVPLNIEVGSVARDLMMFGYPKLKPADASHVATALVARATELHTFDDALLNLNNEIPRLDTGFLRIVKPQLGLGTMPLFEAPSLK